MALAGKPGTAAAIAISTNRCRRRRPGAGLLLAGLPLLLSGCGAAPASIGGLPAARLPLPAGITVAFNHNGAQRYRSPVSGRWRQGDDLEAMILAGIAEARSEILVAVQELSLPQVAAALVNRRRQGVSVKVVMENTYSTPWSEQHAADLVPHQRQRHDQLRALGQGDAVAILRDGHVPMLDDTADGSRGSGLMHHKFMVVDRRLVVTGSANFTPSCIHGDADDPRTRGNVNHLLRFDSPELAAVFAAEFARLWGDGPGGAADSRFGTGKGGGGPQTVNVAGTPVQVLFAPHRRRDPDHGLHWLEQQLAGTRQRLDMALFVFSAQNLTDAMARLRARHVRIRLLGDPGFASRPFSELLDLLGVSLPDRRCRLEAGNRPWQQVQQGVGSPRLPRGDKLHHKFAVIDGRSVITGSFNWSPSAAHQNDETLIRIDSPLLARHFEVEMERLWRGAELGLGGRLQRRQARARRDCPGLAATTIR
ncbi:MAG: phospholipase D-like domain-containing protein [Synechococcaceae cyanobacterium]|jgi:phosphatidylserine/phosphatidylglycerophosphate/cardiolipin synthase-like enzyme